jgi:hypothetical protein
MQGLFTFDACSVCIARLPTEAGVAQIAGEVEEPAAGGESTSSSSWSWSSFSSSSSSSCSSSTHSATSATRGGIFPTLSADPARFSQTASTDSLLTRPAVRLRKVDIQPRDYIPAHLCIADLEGEGDVDVVQLRVLDVIEVICPICSCASFPMQTAGPAQVITVNLQL